MGLSDTGIPAFSVMCACTSFIAAMDVASSLIGSGIRRGCLCACLRCGKGVVPWAARVLHLSRWLSFHSAVRPVYQHLNRVDRSHLNWHELEGGGVIDPIWRRCRRRRSPAITPRRRCGAGFILSAVGVVGCGSKEVGTLLLPGLTELKFTCLCFGHDLTSSL